MAGSREQALGLQKVGSKAGGRGGGTPPDFYSTKRVEMAVFWSRGVSAGWRSCSGRNDERESGESQQL